MQHFSLNYLSHRQYACLSVCSLPPAMHSENVVELDIILFWCEGVVILFIPSSGIWTVQNGDFLCQDDDDGYDDNNNNKDDPKDNTKSPTKQHKEHKKSL